VKRQLSYQSVKVRARNALGLLRDSPRLFLLKAKRKAFRNPLSRHGQPMVRMGDVRFRIDFEFAPVMKSMYDRLYEIETEYIIRRLLRSGGTFVDVGANIGYLSAVALSVVGKRGKVLSFEPAPRYFERLQEFWRLNPEHDVRLYRHALGDAEGETTLNLTGSRNIGWNTVVPGLMRTDEIGEAVVVRVRRLDTVLHEAQISKADFIKIDVEGYEFPVLKGCSEFLAAVKPPILCEIAPVAYPKLGLSLEVLEQFMRELSYTACHVVSLMPIELHRLQRTQNVVFLPQ